MSANDPLPWIAPVLELVRGAVATNVPVIGHCLGGQLMAKAMGGIVTENRSKEIGWSTVHIDANPSARDWFGDIEQFESFQWHGDTFTVPPAATRIASGPYCTNQAFVHGPHLAMQCHVEVDAVTVQAWCAQGAEEISTAAGPAVQTVGAILKGAPPRLTALRRVSDRLYDRWVSGLQSQV
jgi:GMP synthase-like glutamine amidotransferase